MASIGDIQKETNILNHLIEYSSYYLTHEGENLKEAPLKKTVFLLAKLTLYDPDEKLIPPLDRNLFKNIIDISKERIDVLKTSPNQTLPQNMPAELDGLVKNYEDYKKKLNEDGLKKLQAHTYRLSEQQRRILLQKQAEEIVKNSPDELADVFSQGFPQYDDGDIEKLADRIQKTAIECVQQNIDPPTVSEVVEKWYQEDTPNITPDQAENVIKIIDYQNTLSKTYSYGKILKTQGEIEANENETEFRQSVEEILQQNQGKISREEAEDYVRNQTDFKNRLLILDNSRQQIKLLTKNIIDLAIDAVGGKQTEEGKLLDKSREKISSDVFIALGSPANDFAFGTEQSEETNIVNLVKQTVYFSFSAPVNLGKRAAVAKAALALQNSVTPAIQNNPAAVNNVIALNFQNQKVVAFAKVDPRDAMGTAYGSFFSFFLEPDLKKLTESFTGFIGEFPSAVLYKYGSLPALTKLKLFKLNSPQAFNSASQDPRFLYGLNAEQKSAVWEFSQKYFAFSQDHQTISGLIRLKAAIDYEQATGSIKGIALQITPGLLKNIASHPDYTFYFIGEYAKSLAFSMVKEKVRRPVLNYIAVKVFKTHTVDDFGRIRFRPTYFLQRTAGSLTKKLLSKLPASIAKLLIPGVGWAGFLLQFAPDLTKKIIKYLGLGFGVFLAWLLQFGPIAVASSLIGSVIGAAFGWVLGGPFGAIGGFFLGGVLGGLIGIGIIKAWSLITGAASSLLSGLVPTTSAGGLTAATSGMAAAAAPITGVFLVTTVGANLLYNQFLQAGFNPYRLEGLSSTYTQIQSNNLNEIFKQTADQICIPLAALKSISKIEASRTWGYTDEEVAKFSTSGWWKTASQEELERGYCIDTCLSYDCKKINRKTNTYCDTGDTNPNCKKTTVFGPMQFEEITWAARFSCKKNPDGTFDNDCLMERCNLKKAILAAAEKIKTNSNDKETGPCDSTTKSWDKNTMMCRVAGSYCGACGTDWCNNTKRQECSLAPLSEDEIKICLGDPNCGTDYCGTAWTNYQGGGGK